MVIYCIRVSLQALIGPHHYQIADQGGLIVAVPAGTKTPNTVKFSTDEGIAHITYRLQHLIPSLGDFIDWEMGSSEITIHDKCQMIFYQIISNFKM